VLKHGINIKTTYSNLETPTRMHCKSI